MELFEFVLVVLVCVFLSSVIDKFAKRVSLPVIQVAVGLVAAILIPAINELQIESELFLVLFIAPLLFNETRTMDPRELWDNRGSILSLAIGLVVASTLAVGFAFHWLVPSVPLAAAFALGAALGPTDAAAVGALKSQVSLSERQQALLSGESLINDASGVVSFQFAVAAAVTGAFSLANAVESFFVLFLGGILAGVVLGLALAWIMRVLGRLGFQDPTATAFYELIAPFILYLLAEAVGVSGILSVVAGGIVMASRRARGGSGMRSTYESRRRLVSNSMWGIVDMLINGVLFVMLGMQLPHVVLPGLSGGMGAGRIVGVILAVTAVSLACRFVWIVVMEKLHRRKGGTLCGTDGTLARDALVTTIAGAKGAVTLSIVLTLPLAVASGAPFPERDLIITVAAGTILATLLLADSTLPLLAPKPQDDGAHERELREGRLAVREATARELVGILDSGRFPDYVPALRLAISDYQVRNAIERVSAREIAAPNQSIEDEEFQLQTEELERIHQRHLKRHDERDWRLHLRAMRSIRRSVGYYAGRMADVVPEKRLRDRLELLRWRLQGRRRSSSEQRENEFNRIYAQSCMYALELEFVSIELFDRVIAEGDGPRAEAAGIRKETHELAMRSLWDRLTYGQESQADPSQAYELPYDLETGEFKADFADQFRKAREYEKDVRNNALRIELDEIGRLQMDGRLERGVANELRDEVYLMQLGDE